MNKWLLGAVLVIAVIVVYSLVGSEMLRREMKLTQEQAVDFAVQELKFRYPNASIEVFKVENTSGVAGQSWWLIKANVVYGKNTLCPNLTIVDVDQKFNFVPREREIVTENCRVLGCKGMQYCSINYPEEAVIIPLDPDHNPEIQADLSHYINSAGGAQNIHTDAIRYTDEYTTNQNNTYSDVWVVRYTYQDAPNLFEVILNKTSGKIIEYYTVPL